MHQPVSDGGVVDWVLSALQKPGWLRLQLQLFYSIAVLFSADAGLNDFNQWG